MSRQTSRSMPTEGCARSTKESPSAELAAPQLASVSPGDDRSRLPAGPADVSYDRVHPASRILLQWRQINVQVSHKTVTFPPGLIVLSVVPLLLLTFSLLESDIREAYRKTFFRRIKPPGPDAAEPLLKPQVLAVAHPTLAEPHDGPPAPPAISPASAGLPVASVGLSSVMASSSTALPSSNLLVAWPYQHETSVSQLFGNYYVLNGLGNSGSWPRNSLLMNSQLKTSYKNECSCPGTKEPTNHIAVKRTKPDLEPKVVAPDTLLTVKKSAPPQTKDAASEDDCGQNAQAKLTLESVMRRGNPQEILAMRAYCRRLASNSAQP